MSWLNNEPIGFIVSAGPKRWVARDTLPSISSGRHCIWHLDGGALPLMGADSKAPSGVIADPWAGWAELRTGADPNQPYFGPGHPAVIWLDAHPQGKRSPAAIGVSAFGWIGNHYRRIGGVPTKSTEKWWRRLRRAMTKSAVRIPRAGPPDPSSPHAEIWAMPSALSSIQGGTPRESS